MYVHRKLVKRFHATRGESKFLSSGWMLGVLSVITSFEEGLGRGEDGS